MLDQKALRQDLDAVVANLARRGFTFDRARYLALETQRKELQVQVEGLRQARNERSKNIGRAKAAGGDVEALKREVGELGDALAAGEARLGGDRGGARRVSRRAAELARRFRARRQRRARERRGAAMGHAARLSRSRRKTTSRSASGSVSWTSTPPRSSPARGSSCCAARSRGCTARSRN